MVILYSKEMLNHSAVDSVQTAQFFNEEAALIYMWVVYAVVSQAVNVFGISTNTINIVCFVKQGFKDPINISLLGLAVSDMCSLITLSWLNVCYTPAVSVADLPFDPRETGYLIAGIPHIAFSRVASWITAIITLERSLCVILPLQVKQIITHKRMAAIIICVFVILIACESPVYAVVKLHIKFLPWRNKSVLGTIYTPERQEVETISFTINNFCLPLAAFVVIITCTAILVINLRNQTKWRQNLTNQTGVRNENVARMVVMISALFISCFIPMSLVLLVLAIEPEFNVGGKSAIIGIVLFGIAILVESVNSSANIFIYYRMSVKYRKTFHVIFCKHSHTVKRISSRNK